MIDMYGIPRYQEINPAVFYIITFPFLFGIMFGDVGHGLILFIAGLYLNHKCNSKLSPFNNLKWLLILMGFFAIFCGFIYNEFFSISIPI